MELWDLYDNDRIPLGYTCERGKPMPPNTYRIAVKCCIFNSHGQMLIQRRQDTKSGWSGMWDISCGGSVIAGENSQWGIHRELLEELGIDIDFSDTRPILTTYFKQGFNDIYAVIRDVDLGTLKLQEEEVAEVKWADREEIIKMIEDELFIPYHESLISLLFALKNIGGEGSKLR